MASVLGSCVSDAVGIMGHVDNSTNMALAQMKDADKQKIIQDVFAWKKTRAYDVRGRTIIYHMVTHLTTWSHPARVRSG